MNKLTILFSLLFIGGSSLKSQELTQPRLSPLSSVSHRLGIVDIKITYSSPQVKGRKIWGNKVPYDKPWRAGADNNTIFETSHDISINDNQLAAGKYGLHMIPTEKEWVLIFSKNYTSWGSFTYSESEDQLRININPHEVDFQEHLSFQFEKRGYDFVEVSLVWEKIKVPFTIKANVDSLVIANFKEELRSKSQFDWEAWHQAARYCLYRELELEQGLEWVNHSLNGFFASKEVYDNLRTKAGLLEKLDSTTEAKLVLDKALAHPTATALDLYRHGHQVLFNKQVEQALNVFKNCKERYPTHWLSDHGLARAYSALGEYDKAILHEEFALKSAPERSKPYLIENIKKLKKNEDFN